MLTMKEFEILNQVKADVETQGDFVQSLATEVRAASFTSIQDLVAFVNWLDEELSFLVCTLSVSQLHNQSGLSQF